MGVLLNLDYWPNQYDPVDADKAMVNPSTRAALIRAQVTLAAHFAASPGHRVALEFRSEPHCVPTSGPNSWPPIQLATWKAVRQVAPRLPLVLTGCRAVIDKVVALDPTPYLGDPNIIWSFHYYDFFSGQEFQKLRSVPFPPRPDLANSVGAMNQMVPTATAAGNPRIAAQLKSYLTTDGGSATMQRKIDSVAEWARHYGIPASHVSMNEWAPVLTNRPESQAIRPDELRWIATLRGDAEQHGFSWAYWTLPIQDLNYDPSTKFFRKDTQTALGLGQ